jgi:hypothetical protein
VEGARQNAVQALAGAGGQQSGQELGGAMRDQLEAGKASAKAQERALWQAIDPQGNLSINGTPVQQAAQNIVGEMPQTARPMDGEEANIFRAAQTLGPQSSFQDFAALRSRTLDAIRNEAATNGQSQSWRRMQMLRGAMDDTMADAASGVAQQQAQDVAAGRMSPDETMVAKLASEAQAWYGGRNAGTASQTGTGPSVGTGFGRNAPRGPQAVSRLAGTEGASIGGPRGTEGNPSLQSQAQALASVPFDAAAGERYRAAADATRDRAQTFNNPQVGPVLQERGGMYRLGDSQIPPRAIGSPEGSQAFLNAGVEPGTMQDALVADLRQAAINPDGTLNVTKYQTWLRNRGPALQNFPDLQQRLGDAASAQEAVDATSARAKAQSDAYQQSAAQYFLKAEPRQAVTAAFGSKTPQNAFSQLARLTSASPDAQAGLQRAIIDHMMSATQNPQGEFTPAAFGKYLATKRPALAAVFTPDQLNTMDAVAADLQRSNLSVSGNKIPGSPGTAQDLAAARSSLLGNIVRRVAGAGAGYAFGGLHGAIEGALGGEAANAVRRGARPGQQACRRCAA